MHVNKVYKEIQRKYKIPKRAVRWYVTVKLLPQPEHQGKLAYYDVERIQLYSRIECIKLLQGEFQYTLDKVRKIFRKNENIDMDKLVTNLEILKSDFPLKKKWLTLDLIIQYEFFQKLEEGKLNLKKFDLLDLADKIKNSYLKDYFINQNLDNINQKLNKRIL